MKRMYYFSYRSDNYMCVVGFTTLYAAKMFTKKRRENESTNYITWDSFSLLLTKEEAISRTSQGKIFTDWRKAVRELIPAKVRQ